MARINQRLDVIEGRLPGDSLIDSLAECAGGWYRQIASYPQIAALLEETGNGAAGRQFSKRRLPAAVDRGLAVLLRGDVCMNPFDLERLRDNIPDRIIAAVYNSMRNFAFAGSNVRLRQLAGVLDDKGDPLPGYRLLSTGAIVDAAA